MNALATSASTLRQRSRRARSQGSFALVITLALMVVLVLILVIYVSMSQLDYTATVSYSKSMNAEQIARGSLKLVVAQLQSEMGKDALPDTGGGTYPNSPVYINVASTNIEPQGVGTNADIPTLVKISTNAPFFTGSLGTGMLEASPVNTTMPSANGRSVSVNRWEQSYFGTLTSTNEAPCWVILTRNGATNAAGINFGATGNTINNSSTGNSNYAIGRFAYAIYNEGGLLDVTAAGAPLGSPNGIALTPAQLDQIKSTLAGADLSQISGVTTNVLTQWRNTATGSAASPNVYLNQYLIGSSTNVAFISTNAPGNVYPGDTTFISRQDLINAALNGQAGLTTSALTNLTTFTREINQPSWAPSINAASGGIYNYATNATTITGTPFTSATPNPNPLVPLVRVAQANSSYMAYNDNGTAYSDPITAGDPVVRRRFSLARLAWIGPSGPQNGGTAASILACFGLAWQATTDSTIITANNKTAPKVWAYVGSAQTGAGPFSEQAGIKTLSQVAQENPPREPNFFELLQAGILSGSLATAGGNSPYYIDTAQISAPFQILRIGANAICQYNSDCIPRLIEFTGSDNNPWDAAGIQNLPYLNYFKDIAGQSPDDPQNGNNTVADHFAALYWAFGLWNPHQQNPGVNYSSLRPAVRLVLETVPSTGYVGFASGWAANQTPTTPITSLYSGPNANSNQNSLYGYKFNLPLNTVCAPLVSGSAGLGVNGFQNPGLLTPSDVQKTGIAPAWNGPVDTFQIPATVPSSYTAGGWIWQQSFLNPAVGGSSNFTVFRMPDLEVNLSLNPSPAHPYANNYWPTPGGPQINNQNPELEGVYGLFQIVLEYQDPTSQLWIPYDYWAGINDTGTWQNHTFASNGPNINEPTPNPTTDAPPLILPPPYTPIPDPNMAFLESGAGIELYYVSDPRTFRFNPVENDRSTPATYPANLAPIDSLWSGAGGTGTTASIYQAAGYGGYTANSPPTGTPLPQVMHLLPSVGTSGPFFVSFFPATLCRNNIAASLTPGSSYTDTDGIQRIGDSGEFAFSPNPASATPSTGNPYYVGPGWNYSEGLMSGQRTADRPIILNRPFNHVADLGYVFRDDPWRSLDFFSVYNGASTSADSGLLDLFSVHQEPSVIAGRIDLNTQNPAVLQALLSQSVVDAVGNVTSTANAVMTSSATQSLAQQMVAYTAANPLANKDQLVTKLNPALTAAAFGVTPSPANSTDPQYVKSCREAFIRTLADVGQTRTWNLMIDLVAQSGRYAPNATSLSQFTVQSEKRYWLHVAIDRFTGKIIDQKLEPVNQ